MTQNQLPNTTSDALPTLASAAGPLSTTVIEPAPRVCSNCQTAMHGPFCYQCGQHERTSLRHVGLLLRDILQDVLNLDSRAIRTLKPLLLKPGYLTLEYFAGRRQRYVPPLRLYVIASLVFFLIAGWVFSAGEGLKFDNDEQQAANEALDEPEVQQALQNPEVAAVLERTSPAMRDAMAERGLGADAKKKDQAVNAPAVDAPKSGSSTEKTAAEPAGAGDAEANAPRITVLGNISFLPEFANQWIIELNAEVNEKAKRIKDDPKKLAEAVLSVLPQSMFILLPLFALLLKLFYPFANRLYMEHLIVALHSHCFMFLLFTLLIVCNHVLGDANNLLGDAFGLNKQWPWLTDLVETITGLLLTIGVPLYLYLMQKRVYGQGHWLTFSKFMLIGMLYLTLLAVVVAVDIVLGILQL